MKVMRCNKCNKNQGCADLQFQRIKRALEDIEFERSQ